MLIIICIQNEEDIPIIVIFNYVKSGEKRRLKFSVEIMDANELKSNFHVFNDIELEKLCLGQIYYNNKRNDKGFNVLNCNENNNNDNDQEMKDPNEEQKVI